jgi:hypothetical protein
LLRLSVTIVVIIIIIIITIIPVIPFMHGIYNYVPETNHDSTVYSVAAVLYLQSVLRVMLFGMLNMFCTFTSALPTVPNIAVFCSPSISPFRCMLLRYSLYHFETVPVAHIIAGIALAFTVHMG